MSGTVHMLLHIRLMFSFLIHFMVNVFIMFSPFVKAYLFGMLILYQNNSVKSNPKNLYDDIDKNYMQKALYQKYRALLL